MNLLTYFLGQSWAPRGVTKTKIFRFFIQQSIFFKIGFLKKLLWQRRALELVNNKNYRSATLYNVFICLDIHE